MKILNELREKSNLSISKLAINLNDGYGTEKDAAMLADYFNVSGETFTS